MSLALALPTAVLAELVDPPLALAAGPQAVAEGPPDAEAPGEPGQTYWAEAGVMEPKVPNVKPTANRAKQGHAVDRRRMSQRRKIMLAPKNIDGVWSAAAVAAERRDAAQT